MRKYVRLIAGFVFIVCVNIFGARAYGDEVIPSSEFEDARFYEYVLQVFDANGDGVLTKEEAEEVRDILVNNESEDIESIKGIQHLTGLRHVNIHGQKITDGSYLGSLSNAMSLVIDETGISDISFLQNMTGLMNLAIRGSEKVECAIKDFSSIAYLTELTEIILSFCDIKDISFLSGLNNLGYVQIENTGLKDISPLMASKDILHEIFFYECEIEDISYIKEMSNLHNVYILYNTPKITELPDMTGFSEALEMIQFGGNEVTEDEALKKLPSHITSRSGWQKIVGVVSGNTDNNEPSIENNTTSGSSTENNTTQNSNTNNNNTENPTADDGRTLISVIDSGIAVTGKFEEGVYFEGKRIEDISDYQGMLEKIHGRLNNILGEYIYDLSFYKDIKENGKITKQRKQPDGMVEVIIDLEKVENGRYHVFRQEEDGSLTELECFVRAGKLHFYSEHFSIFTIIITKFFDGEEGQNDADEKTALLNETGLGEAGSNETESGDEAITEAGAEVMTRVEMKRTDKVTEEKAKKDNVNGVSGGNNKNSGKGFVIGGVTAAAVVGIIIVYESVRKRKALKFWNTESEKNVQKLGGG